MKIGGFVKQSLIDYPGKIAAVVFTQGCNFRCGYCHNPQLVLPSLFPKQPEYTPEGILKYLESRKNWLDGVVVTGGEPTIHNDLPIFMKDIKALGYDIKLDTNGSNPLMLDKIIKDSLADYIAMDVKVSPQKKLYEEITGIQMFDEIFKKIIVSILVLKNSPINGEFRTTYIPGIHDQTMVELIQHLIGGEKMYTVNQFREGNTIASKLVLE